MNFLFIFLKGFAMGAANVVPGVSGGTIAFITGIYERLINSLKSFDLQALTHLRKFDLGSFAKHIDAAFLAPLFAGVVVSILTLAKVLKVAFESHPTLIGAFFFGLILASVFSVARMVRRWAVPQIIALLVGLVIAVGLAFLSPASENKSILYLGLCGVIGMSSMIIPGVSGSFVLLLMGNYKLIMLDGVNNLRQFKLSEALPVLVPVGIGAVLGLAALARILGWLFKKYHDTAVALITGFVAGSLYEIWPWKRVAESVTVGGKTKILASDRYLPAFGEMTTWNAAGLILAGIAIILIMEKFNAAGRKN